MYTILTFHLFLHFLKICVQFYKRLNFPKGYQHAPGVGRAISEIYTKGNFQDIDLTRFNFNRIMQEVKLFDSCII